MAFGALFIALFVVVAIAEGVGDPSIPSGDVVLLDGAPGTSGDITQAEFDHALEVAALSGGAKKVPKPGEPEYEELKKTSLNGLIETARVAALAAENGVEATDEEIAKEFKKLKDESFKSEAEFQKFLKESHYTQKDLNERVKLQILGNALQEKVKEEVPTPTQSEIEDYYDAAKSTQFTQKPTRDVRMIVNKDRKKAEEAFSALQKDNSAKNWAKVAKQYSEDPTTKKIGGLQKALPEGVLEEPLNAKIFSTPEGQVEGPIKDARGYTVFQVENSTPESVQELKAVESQIQSTLAQRLEQEYFTAFVTDFNDTWTARTFCAPGYVTERCSNYAAEAHPSTAPPACYEANPKTPAEACPAPVFQLIPALPGSITVLEPKGKPLAQRPRPVEEASEAESATEVPEGAVPPAGEAPSE